MIKLIVIIGIISLTLIILRIVAKFLDNCDQDYFDLPDFISKICKKIEYNHHIIIAIICVCIFLNVIFILLYFAYAETVAVYDESEYNLESITKDFIEIANNNKDKYTITRWQDTDDKKYIRILHYVYRDIYEIRLFGFGITNNTEEMLDQIADKYKKE